MIRSEFFLEKVSIPSNSLRLDMNNPSDPISRQHPGAPTQQSFLLMCIFISGLKCKVLPKQQLVKSPKPGQTMKGAVDYMNSYETLGPCSSLLLCNTKESCCLGTVMFATSCFLYITFKITFFHETEIVIRLLQLRKLWHLDII